MSCSNVDSTNVHLMTVESGMMLTRGWGKVNDGFCISAREGQLVLYTTAFDSDSKKQCLFQEDGTKGSRRFYCKEMDIFSSYLIITHNVTYHPTNVNSFMFYTSVNNKST